MITALGERSRAWGVILAGGDGTRLLPLTRAMTGDNRPKQFCAVNGSQTLLEETVGRVRTMIVSGRILFVLSRAHEPFFDPHLRSFPSRQLLVQPLNKGTTPAILYSLLRIQAQDRDGVVAFFPSDHYVSNPGPFQSQVRLALDFAGVHRDLIILLGIKPSAAEMSYGWIEPGDSVANTVTDSLSRVNRFWEKPSRTRANRLYRQGCLWNSFIMTGKVGAFLHMIRDTVPDLHERFESIRPWLLTPLENEALADVYAGLAVSSFSNEILATNVSRLAVLQGSEFDWMDLGEPARVFELYRRAEIQALEESCRSGGCALESGARG